ncbi:hypothetical protein HLRTI_003453 [Halorhabdus tiamatea SARL4B]|uniref:Uncharacterized protein n=1 Tax=Halorhabdus tiamatea SARL4B TaxID=1033806 RepID=U2F2F3_9EURY|nr:hypothetical protein HLRTI_003453 [Halorhabdus tiamatea SARL4B]
MLVKLETVKHEDGTVQRFQGKIWVHLSIEVFQQRVRDDKLASHIQNQGEIKQNYPEKTDTPLSMCSDQANTMAQEMLNRLKQSDQTRIREISSNRRAVDTR